MAVTEEDELEFSNIVNETIGKIFKPTEEDYHLLYGSKEIEKLCRERKVKAKDINPLAISEFRSKEKD